jgi:hypothetical protein
VRLIVYPNNALLVLLFLAARPAAPSPDPRPTRGLAAGEFDYTFTNQELEDVLGFLERRQSNGSEAQDAQPPLALPGPLSLQFQVRDGGPSRVCKCEPLVAPRCLTCILPSTLAPR